MNYFGPLDITDSLERSNLPVRYYSTHALILTAKIQGYRKPNKLILAHKQTLDDLYCSPTPKPLFRSSPLALRADYRESTIITLAASLSNYWAKHPSGLLVLCYEDTVGIESLKDFRNEFEQTIHTAATLRNLPLVSLR